MRFVPQHILRPFDDQSNLRIHLEAEAIKTIIRLVEQQKWNLVSSKVLKFEISKIADESRRKELMLMESLAGEVVQINTQIGVRANEFERLGIQSFDALHLACSENNADILLTVDDRLMKKALIVNNLNISVRNPLIWLSEVLP